MEMLPGIYRWIHIMAGVMWVGLLYYFNFVQVPAMKAAQAVAAFTLQAGYQKIGVGAWLGTIMLLNVWGIIWPNQKKILGIVPATDEQKNKARRVAFLASRTNTALSVPMLFFMVAQTHIPM